MTIPWLLIYLICRQQLSCLLLLTCLLLARLTLAHQQTNASIEVLTTDIPEPTSTLHYGLRYPYRNTSFLSSFTPYSNTSRPVISRTYIPAFTAPPIWPNVTVYTTYYTTEIVMATYCPCVPDPHDLDDAIRMCSSSRTLTVTLTATVTGCMGGSKDKCTHAYSHGYPVPTHMEEEDGEEYDNGDEDEHKEIPGGEGGEEECDGSDEDEYNEVSEGEEVEEYYNCDEDEYKDIPEEMEGEGEEEEEKQEKEELNDSEGSCIPPSPTLKPTSSDLVDYDNEKCRGGCQTGVPQVTFSHEYSIKSPPNLSTPTSKLTRSKTITITYTVTDSTTHPSFSEDKSSTVNSPDSDPSNTHKIGHSSTTSTSWATQGSPTYTGSASRFVHAPRKVTGQLGILMGCIWVGFVMVGRV